MNNVSADTNLPGGVIILVFYNPYGGGEEVLVSNLRVTGVGI